MQGILNEELAGLDKKAVEAEATGIKMPPPPPEDLDDVCLSEDQPSPFFNIVIGYLLLTTSVVLAQRMVEEAVCHAF